MKRRRTGIGCASFAACLLFTALAPPGLAEEESSARLYRSPDERREAGVGHEITKWLTVSGLAEAETDYVKDARRIGNKLAGQRKSSQSFQLGFDAEITDRLRAEITFEYEIDHDYGAVDEALVEYEADHWSLSLGRENIKFGEYFSHFASGPLLEFGETRADAVTIGYKFSTGLEIFGFGFEGDVMGVDQGGKQTDYGGGFELTLRDEVFMFGLTYLSDLSESDEQFLLDAGSRYQARVAGLNAYILLVMQQFEVTAETVMALTRFRELEVEIDQPGAYNLELAWRLRPKWQLV